MFKRIAAIVLSTAMLAACGGGSNGSSITPQLPTAGGKTTTVTFTVKVPGKTVATAHGVKPLYISTDTKGIGIAFQAHSGSGYTNATTDTSPNAGMAIAAGAGGCGSAVANGSYSCTISIAGVPVGYDDFRFTLWNAAPTSCATNGTGCSFTGDKAIAVQTLANYGILTGQSNTVPLTATFYPVVDSIAVSLSNGIVDGGGNTTAVANTVFKDAQGDIILTNEQLLDDTGANLTATLNISNDGSGACATNQTKANGCSLYFTNGSCGAGPATNPTITHATDAATAETICYDGVTTFPTSGSVPQVAASTSGAVSGTSIPATFAVTSSSSGSLGVPGVPQVALHPAVASPGSVINGSDNNLYVVSGSGIKQVTTAGSAAAVTLAGDASDQVQLLAAGSDGDLWWVDGTTARIDREAIGTSPAAGSFGSVGIVGSKPASTATGGLTSAPAAPALTDNTGGGSLPGPTTEYVKISYTNASGESIGSAEASVAISSGDSVTVTSPSASTGATGYRVYATINAGNEALVQTTPTSIGTNFTITADPNQAQIGALLAGPDGNMWFDEYNGQFVEHVNPNDLMTVTSTSVAQNAYGFMASGTFANGDKAVCYTIASFGISCYDVTQANAAATTFTMPGSASADAIAFGGDGLLYVATNTNKVYALNASGSGAAVSINNVKATYTLGNLPTGMTYNAYDGSIWLTESTHALARIQPEATLGSGTLVEYPLTNVYAAGTPDLWPITADSFGQLWSSDTGTASGQLDQIQLH